MRSSLDVLLLERRLRLVQNDLDVNEICMKTARANFDKDMFKLEARRGCLLREAEGLAKDLYWLRMRELIHTPCWRYRVSA